MRKWISIILVLLGIIIASGFFLLPLGKQDWDVESYNVDINNDPGFSFEDLLDAHKVELWLRNKETPANYTVAYNQTPDSLFSFIRTSDKGETQTVSLQKIHHQGDGIIYLSYDIENSGHSYTKTFHIALAPEGNLIVSGGSATTTKLIMEYRIDYTETGYFGKLIPKWKSILWGTKYLREEAKAIGSNIKQSVEDNHGRLLQYQDER